MGEVITTPLRFTAGRTRKILVDWSADDPPVPLVDGSIGDRQPEFHSPDYGVGNKRRKNRA